MHCSSDDEDSQQSTPYNQEQMDKEKFARLVDNLYFLFGCVIASYQKPMEDQEANKSKSFLYFIEVQKEMLELLISLIKFVTLCSCGEKKIGSMKPLQEYC